MAIEVAIKKKIGNFSLDVAFSAGEEMFALLGASGCGKSMTLKCIAGIETPDEGKIVLNGRTLFDSEKKINLIPQKRKVGYMFQDYALFPNMTVEKNIMAGMGKKPEKAIVQDYIRRFRLEGLEHHLPRQLSGGQKQRVALARMMASQPEILLLDEPLSALDSFLKWQVEEELQDLLSEIGKTVLFVSHSRDEVYHLCDRICVLEKGHMETIQEKKEFFANPVTQAAARISGCRNIVPAKRLSAHQLEVPDWGICFELEKEIPEDISFVGVRAHYIEVSADLEPAKNSSIMQMDRLLEQQFESELVLKYNQDTMSLRILMDKEQAEHNQHTHSSITQIALYFGTKNIAPTRNYAQICTEQPQKSHNNKCNEHHFLFI